MELRYEDLVLRQPDERDLEAIVTGCRDPEVLRYIPMIPSPYAVADATEFLEAVRTNWRDGQERTFSVVNSACEFLGVVTIRLREGGTVGYWIAPSARGRGVATRAVKAVVEWAAAEQGIARLQLMTHPGNLGSQRVAEKAGFRRIGTTAHEPPFRDGTDWAVLFERS